jgi:hypothetical protein
MAMAAHPSCDRFDAQTAVPNARLRASFLNGSWRRECAPLSLTPAGVARVPGTKFAAAPKAAQAQRVENLILAWEAAAASFRKPFGVGPPLLPSQTLAGLDAFVKFSAKNQRFGTQ